ncbi:hypothetical protein D1007_48866 [Hordeum vulgare]|nr:hypothetical protein D1007_48866 [Hordeum vulgare]
MVNAAFDHFSEFDLLALDALFTDDEIWDVVKSLPAGKAPGPDGFTSKFLVACWDTIKHDFRKAFDKLYSMNGRSFQKLNEALLTLLPKRADARSLYDYRTISLIHIFAKLVAKLLSLRLSPHLGSMVSTNQSAFIGGRCIHDNFMLVQQTARLLHDLKAPRMLLKLDIAWAFDNVSWPFLLHFLAHLGFGPRWREWISILLSTASTRVLINGHPGPPIDHAHGLRQGDPVSPMLFMTVIDVLNSMLLRAVDADLLHRLTTWHAASSISLYADDVVVFCHPNSHDIAAVRTLLHVFGTASKLHTNFNKCSATPIRCIDDHITMVTSEMQCPVAHFPITYLGLPLAVPKAISTSLEPILDNLGRKLSTWRASMLSQGDHLALVRHVLYGIPTHFLMAIAFNKTAIKKRTDPSRPWSHLPIPHDADANAIFRACTSWQLGSGDTCRFWTDHWINGRSVAEIAPLVYALVPRRPRKDRIVRDGLHLRSWVHDIRGAFGSATMVQYVDLWCLVRHTPLSSMPDMLSWRWTASGTYSASSCYKALFLGACEDPHCRLTWRPWAPLRVRFFLWLAMQDRC